MSLLPQHSTPDWRLPQHKRTSRLWRLSAWDPRAGRLATRKSRLLGMETAISSLGPHAVVPLGVSVFASLYKAMGQKELGPKLMTSSYLHYFLKAPSPSTVTFWGPKYQNQHMISGDDTVQSKAASQKKKIYTHTQIHIYISGLS